MRAELKTWRYLNVLHGVMISTLQAAEEDGVQGRVGIQLREAGLYIAAALATLEAQADDSIPQQPTSITCPRCGLTSHNRNDIEQGYCGNCHWWTSHPGLGAVEPPS